MEREQGKIKKLEKKKKLKKKIGLSTSQQETLNCPDSCANSRFNCVERVGALSLYDFLLVCLPESPVAHHISFRGAANRRNLQT